MDNVLELALMPTVLASLAVEMTADWVTQKLKLREGSNVESTFKVTIAC